MPRRRWIAVLDCKLHSDTLASLKIPFRQCTFIHSKDNVLIFLSREKDKFLDGLGLDKTRVCIAGDKKVVDKDGQYLVATLLEINKREEFDELKSRENYIECCAKFLEDKIIASKDRVQTQREKIKSLQRDLTAKLRDFNLAEAELNHLRGTVAQEKKAAFSRNFDELIKTPHVAGVIVDGRKISVFTDQITIDPGKGRAERDIGEFRIDILSNGELWIHNLTRMIDGCYDHPNIEEHDPCLGNLSEVIPELMADYQFSTVAMLVIKLLCSYNPDDCYCELSAWPTVKKLKEAKKK